MATLPPTHPPALAPEHTDNTPAEAVKGCLVFVAALVVVGGIAEMLYKFSPTGSYMFVAVVIIGYAASGDRITAVSDFFTSLGGKK